MSQTIADEKQMLDLGRRLAQACRGGAVIYLHGPLGAGKTTLVRGFMGGLGYTGSVKSPTYTLIEPYDINDHPVYHLDLYRIADAQELEYLGLRDLCEREAVLLVEWPDRGAGMLPPPDISITLAYQGSGRALSVESHSEIGRRIAAAISI